MLTHDKYKNRRALGVSAAVILVSAGCAYGQLSSSAYRLLGQTNFNGNGVNLVQGRELNFPSATALDTRGKPVHVYISDTLNNRILGWSDVSSYQIGDLPAIVLGQASQQSTIVRGIGSKGLSSPLGLAVDPTSGNLYVADFGGNRVLRFPSPFDNPTRVEPDAVYGQPGFTTFSAGTVSATSLNGPRAVAFDSSGNLWVADTGNNRIVRFPSASLNAPAPVTADWVIGQTGFTSGAANAGAGTTSSGLNVPAGIAFDGKDNLYVADYLNSRVVRFAPPSGSSPAAAVANAVWGQSDFTSSTAPATASASSLAGPAGVAVDGNGNLYVVTPGNNRVLTFSAPGSNGSAAKAVIGQPDFTTTTSNTSAYPLASSSTLANPQDVKVDASGNLYVSDAGNNRVLVFPAGAKSANNVWGQSDFVSNGPNMVKPTSVNYPYQVVIDYSQAPFPLYVSDTGNNRVLIWKDSAHFQSGDPADLVIGQPNLSTAAANLETGVAATPSSTSLSSPTGIAVAADGTLYVADFGNNRVLRFPRPVNQNGRITPDAVLGQTNFTSAVSSTVNATSLNKPTGLAIGPNGDLFVADGGNNRVLEFPAGAATNAAAVRVFGQPTMALSTRPTQISAQSLTGPQGLFVDQASNLYVADTGSNRVLVFSNTQNAPASGLAASAVIGQADFNGTPGPTAFRSPIGVSVDSNGSLYVGDSGNNRVLIFSWPGYLSGGASASGVIGQQSVSGIYANWDSGNGLATADGLYNPVAVYLDRQDTLYVGDSGNNRLLHFLKAGVMYHGATLASNAPVAVGSIATFKGSGLVSQSDSAVAPATSWPTTMLNRQVVVNDQLVSPIYYLGPGQVNFQVPSATPTGQQRVAVRTGDTNELIAGGTIIAASVAPGIFTLTQNGSGQGAVLNQDNTINGPGNPAAVGSTIQIYGTGQGQVSPAVPDGSPAPSQPTSSTVAVNTTSAQTCFATQPSMCIAIGSAFGNISYSGLAPGAVGLWQINVKIPSGIVTGNAVGVRVVIDGASSNLVTIAVK